MTTRISPRFCFVFEAENGFELLILYSAGDQHRASRLQRWWDRLKWTLVTSVEVDCFPKSHGPSPRLQLTNVRIQLIFREEFKLKSQTWENQNAPQTWNFLNAYWYFLSFRFWDMHFRFLNHECSTVNMYKSIPKPTYSNVWSPSGPEKWIEDSDLYCKGEEAWTWDINVQSWYSRGHRSWDKGKIP